MISTPEQHISSEKEQIKYPWVAIAVLLALIALVVWNFLKGDLGSVALLLVPLAGLSILDTLFRKQRKHDEINLLSMRGMKEEIEMLLDRYEVLTDNLAAAVIVREPNGTIAYCSPYTEVLTGYSVSEIYAAGGDSFLNIVHPDDREQYKRALKVSAVGEAFQYRYRFHHKSGIEMWAETRTVPIIGDSGGVVSTLSITLDVTGTLRYQKQVEEKNRDLQEFTYMVTHDLKSPIYTIKGMTNMIEEDFKGKLDPALAQPLEHIGTATKRLETLVSSVLEYSKLSATDIKSEPVDLRKLLDEVVHDCIPQAKTCGAEIELVGTFPAVLGDKVRLYQVFSNLIGNALKYRSQKRPLRVSVRMENETSGHHATITIADNGLGIPETKIKGIFRPFQRAHGNTIEGSGIGLACVKKIVDKLGGRVAVSSTEGTGSTFSVTLKRAQPHQSEIKGEEVQIVR